MDVFDSDNNGYVTTEDIKRVARLLGDELDEADTRQMLRSVARPGDDVLKVPKKRLRHMLPPLYPAHSLRRGDLVFSAGETDPAFYILLDGDVLISHSFLLRPRSGFASKSGRELSLGLHRLRTGESFGETELLGGCAAASVDGHVCVDVLCFISGARPLVSVVGGCLHGRPRPDPGPSRRAMSRPRLVLGLGARRAAGRRPSVKDVDDGRERRLGEHGVR